MLGTRVGETHRKVEMVGGKGRLKDFYRIKGWQGKGARGGRKETSGGYGKSEYDSNAAKPVPLVESFLKRGKSKRRSREMGKKA